MSESKQILAVTGANGFVGSAFVARALQEPRFTLRCVVRKGSDCSALEALAKNGADIEFAYADITKPDTLKGVFDGAWGVVNLAGLREFWSRKRDDFYQLNEHGAENVFKACLDSGVQRVVQVSTPLAFGIPDRIPFDEDTEAGDHPTDYARSKYLGDQAGWRLHEARGLPLTIVYLAAVIGAGDDKQTMEVRRAVEKKMPALVGADTTYTYLYRGDAAEAITRALLKDDAVGDAFLIGDQRATTREYFNKIGRIAGVPIPKRNIPEKLLIPFAKGLERIARLTGKRPELPLDVLNTVAAGSLLFDASHSKEALGMQYTSLDKALQESVAEILA
ncbi:MAG: NAD-dependent epimerase/dehydratase family protein [Gammaproteobacteria bacterium]|nr:NAD-dependent epimerase/dehydratase family protein [Gammaproteobacteria bacterium]NNL11866.1 NAD-dependent epimerase/dehydratase family protein [Pseudomonadales bacterium]NNM11315.1 NAD-dependent epimerase/dehydratase family protein [Pseudomonadales bacterium]RZV56167.1 MAG: NAD-dependent epimerase/dehydratase family protein [Pseudomonadales bacterium]